ncbi:hypothetical protein ScPMuIL_009155 [Solemya velum]
MWNAVSTYITNLSNAVAVKQSVKGEHITSKYFGIFFLILQWYVIIGNLVASLILRNSTGNQQTQLLPNISSKHMYVNYTNYGDSNGTGLFFNLSQKQMAKNSYALCGSNYCHYHPIEHEGMKVDDTTKNILLGVYTACGVISLLVISLFLEPLKTYRGTSIECRVVLEQLTSVIKFFVDRRFMMLWLICMYGLMQNGFLTSEVTKAFVTCPLGVYMVGYVMICFGICGAISSYASGWLNKHVGRITLLCTAAVTNLALMIFMLLWTPTADLYVYFIVFGIWGIGNGIWSSQINSLVGTIFSDRSEEAFASQRMLQGLGTTIGYFYAKHMCMMEKIYILGAICVLGMILYIAMEIIFRRKNMHNEKIYKQTSV